VLEGPRRVRVGDVAAVGEAWSPHSRQRLTAASPMRPRTRHGHQHPGRWLARRSPGSGPGRAAMEAAVIGGEAYTAVGWTCRKLWRRRPRRPGPEGSRLPRRACPARRTGALPHRARYARRRGVVRGVEQAPAAGELACLGCRVCWAQWGWARGRWLRGRGRLFIRGGAAARRAGLPTCCCPWWPAAPSGRGRGGSVRRCCDCYLDAAGRTICAFSVRWRRAAGVGSGRRAPPGPGGRRRPGR
jgi:hypothetical protein